MKDLEPNAPARRPDTVINEIALALQRQFSPGDRAELRRVQPEEPSAPIFWKIVALYLEPSGLLVGAGPLRDQQEQQWAVALNALALLEGLHTPGARLGRALATAGFSELRFSRLLRARGENLYDNVRQTARYLASKGSAVDVADFARLLLWQEGAGGEKLRRGLARDYFARINQE